MSIKGFMDQNGQVQKYDFTALENIPEDLVNDSDLAAVVAVQNTAPDDERTKIWIKETSSGGGIRVPTYEEFAEVQEDIDGLKSELQKVSSPTDEQVETAVTNWLNEHPEATTTLQDGSVTEEKLAPDVMQMIEDAANSATIKMSNILDVGQIFEKPEGLPYCGWSFNNLQYDKDTNEIVFIINAAVKHGDNGTVHLYLGKLNLETYDVSIKEIGDPAVLGHGFYTMGFCINDDGDYLYIDAQSKMLGKSIDKGETWTETSVSTYNSWPESIKQLSNGRYLFWGDGNRGVWYSDDDCETWTKASMSNPYFEAFFLELPDNGIYSGTVMCFMRKSTNGTNNGAWNGTKIQESICTSISHDYGATWSTPIVSTTLLEGCANIATAFYHADEDLVEVFTSPRFPYGDTKGAIWQYLATREDALADKFGTPKAVLYAKAKAYQDFGHIGGCFDGDGNMHLMYYDGDSSVSGSVNYYYMKASRTQATLPTHSSETGSLFLPYSGAQADQKVAALRKELMKKINEIIISGGGDVDDPDFYVTDALKIDLDFTDLSKIDNVNGKITDTFGQEFSGSFDENKVLSGHLTIPKSILQTAVVDNTQFSIELCVDALMARNGTQNDVFIYYKDVYTFLLRSRQNVYRWVNSDSTSKSATVDNHGSLSNLIYQLGKTQIVLVFGTDGIVKTYRNNTLIVTYTCEDFLNYSSQFLQLWYLAKNNYFAIKAFRLYNKALTEAEIEQNYNYFNS